MRLIRTITLAAAAAAFPLAAHAADAITVPVSTQAVVPVQDYDSGFDWTGFYAGVYGVAQSSTVGGLQYGLGIDVGANAAFDFFLIGGEVAYHGMLGGAGGTSYIQAIGKAGVLVNDDLAVYAAAGYGFDLGPPAEDDVLLGGGIEYAVSDSMTVRAQYLHGFPITGGNPKEQFTLGANFHF